MSIQFFDYEKAKGYQVRVFRNGETITKFFSCKKSGGKRKALILARQTEQQLEKLYPIFPSRKKKFHAIRPNKNGKSGIAGIRAFILNRPRARSTLQFFAQWSNGCIQRSAYEHGILGALQQVLDAREKATGIKMPSARQAWAIIRRNMGWRQ